MNTTLPTAAGRLDTEHTVVHLAAPPARRVGLLDRLALHAGLALITWSRRPRRIARTDESHEHELELVRERARVDHDAAVAHVLMMRLTVR